MRASTLLATALAALALAAVGSAASPPKAPAGNAFQSCLKKHGVTLGKTTDQKTIRAAFVACRSSAPGAPPSGRPRTLSPAAQAAFEKYTTCLSKHGVKISFKPGQRPSRPPNRTSAKVRAAQKACASLRPRFRGGPPQPAGSQ